MTQEKVLQHQPRMEGLPWGKHSSLFSQTVSDKKKVLQHQQLMSVGLARGKRPSLFFPGCKQLIKNYYSIHKFGWKGLLGVGTLAYFPRL